MKNLDCGCTKPREANYCVNAVAVLYVSGGTETVEISDYYCAAHVPSEADLQKELDGNDEIADYECTHLRGEK